METEENRIPTLSQNRSHSKDTCKKISLAITEFLENFFSRWGFAVASNPQKFILGTVLLTAVCGLGFINFTPENRPDKLWISRTSEFALDTEWLRKNFPSPIRFSWASITAENVLTPEVFKIMLDIRDKVNKINVDDRKWNDICFKLPITKFGKERRKRSIGKGNHSLDNGLSKSFDDAFDDDFFGESEEKEAKEENKVIDSSLHLPDEIYCSIINDLDETCWEISPLEMWAFNRSLIHNLTSNDIIEAYNHLLISPVFGRRMNYTSELGGNIERNEAGEIVKAGSLWLRWPVAINQSVVKAGKALSDMGTGEIVDETCLKFEKEWVELMEEISHSLPPGINLFYATGRSWGDISEATMLDDGLMLVVGFAIMFVYVGLMLGKFNAIEQRPYLSCAGICCVGMAVVVSYGVCSMCTLMYSPVNKILPFLILGIGIDDMFVIMQCWNNLYPNCLTTDYKQSIPERMGHTLRRAGVSITVTSLTDVAAFAVGASTILPGLQSFCIYAAVGIIAVFTFQATFFVAWFAIDQKRLENRKHAFFFWKTHADEHFVPSSWSQKSYSQLFFYNILSKYLFKPPVKVLVVILTGFFLGVNIYGNLKLRQEFDPIWFLPESSYLSKFISSREENYPGYGYPAFIVADQVNWTASLKVFDNFTATLKNSDAIFQFENWYDDFKEYANTNFRTDIPNTPMTPKRFQKFMAKFLFSAYGSKYRAYFKVDGNITCGDPLPPIKLTMMQFRFKTFSGPEVHIPKMHEVKNLVKNANLTYNANSQKRMFAWTTGFVSWETDEIITGELYRNVAISFLCVLVTTFLLLANLRVCLFCGICVIFTLINVGGLMHFWGLTIDTVSCIDIVLAIGLCVDYAAHIGLAFLTCTGTRDSRAMQALSDIGPAVLNGGFSTFLAIILLADSESHAFKSFFKIFTVVVFFGLYHGLIFLPVILSIFGPEPYQSAYKATNGTISIISQKDNLVELRTLTNGDMARRVSKTNGDPSVVTDPLLEQSECKKVLS